MLGLSESEAGWLGSVAAGGLFFAAGGHNLPNNWTHHHFGILEMVQFTSCYQMQLPLIESHPRTILGS